LVGFREGPDNAGALVYVTGFASAPPSGVALLHQRDEQFEPRLLPIVAGQTVSFPNHDRIYHNVFSVSPDRPFDLGQYKSKDPPRDVEFDHPGLVPVYCNIHPQMLAYVVVLENDAFAMSASDGSFEIDGLPAGALELHAWIPGAKRVTVPVAIEPGAERVVELRLDQEERIPPHKRKDGSDYPKPRYEDD
jgi:plastocyanin